MCDAVAMRQREYEILRATLVLGEPSRQSKKMYCDVLCTGVLFDLAFIPIRRVEIDTTDTTYTGLQE